MAKVSKLESSKITSLPGGKGKSPLALVEEFLTKRGYDPKGCLQFRDSEVATWTVKLKGDDELEITLEKISQYSQMTIYLGINLMPVPLKYTETIFASALAVADSLVGSKISLVDYDLVLSVAHFAQNMTMEDLEYFVEILTTQKSAVKDAILDGMKIDFN